MATPFDFSEVQANYILEMPLRRLTKFSRIELEAEADELRATIAGLSEILDDPARLRAVVSDELAEVDAVLRLPVHPRADELEIQATPFLLMTFCEIPVPSTERLNFTGAGSSTRFWF